MQEVPELGLVHRVQVGEADAAESAEALEQRAELGALAARTLERAAARLSRVGDGSPPAGAGRAGAGAAQVGGHGRRRRVEPARLPRRGDRVWIVLRHADVTRRRERERRAHDRGRLLVAAGVVHEPGEPLAGAGAVGALRAAVDDPLGDVEDGANRLDDLVAERGPGGGGRAVVEEPATDTGPLLEEVAVAAGRELLRRQPRQRRQLLRGDDERRHPCRPEAVDLPDGVGDLRLVPAQLAAEALHVLDQEALAGAELLLVDLLAPGDHDVEAAHEVARARVEPLDLAGQPLDLRPQLAPIRLLGLEELRDPAERVADRGQPRSLECADRVGELVERLEERLHPLGGLGDRVRVAVASQLARGAGKARVELAAHRAPRVELVESRGHRPGVELEAEQLAHPRTDRLGPEAQAEVPVLEIQRAHDPAVALRTLDNGVLEHAMGSEGCLGGDPAFFDLVPARSLELGAEAVEGPEGLGRAPCRSTEELSVGSVHPYLCYASAWWCDEPHSIATASDGLRCRARVPPARRSGRARSRAASAQSYAR